MRLISSRGILLPVTFEAAVTTINLVLDCMAFSMSHGFTMPSLSALTIECCTPYLSSALRGLRTELCSIDVVMAWSPFLRNPFKPMFKASVVFLVNTSLSPFLMPKSPATLRLAWYTSSPVLRDMACPDLPGLPQYFAIHSFMAAIISFGFGKDVAPLSRYIIFVSPHNKNRGL